MTFLVKYLKFPELLRPQDVDFEILSKLARLAISKLDR
jgi:hypothetical protein